MTLIDVLASFIRKTYAVDPNTIIDFNALINGIMDKRPIRRRTERFWPASINSSYDCERKQAFSRIEQVFTDKAREDPSRLRAADLGTLIHKHYQDAFFGPSGILFGNWVCPNCRKQVHQFTTYPAGYCRNAVIVREATGFNSTTETAEYACEAVQKAADAAGRPKWAYSEIKVTHEELNIHGRVDGVVLCRLNGRLKWFVLELKSVGHDAFRDLQQSTLDVRKFPAMQHTDLVNAPILVPSYFRLPNDNHISQGGIYAQLLLKAAHEGTLPLNPADHAGTFFVYIDRDNGDARTFVRKSSEQPYNEAVASITRIMRVVGAAEKTTVTDPVAESSRVESNRKLVMSNLRAPCTTRTSPKAAVCPWQTVCFPYKDTKKNKVEFMI